MKSTEVNTSNEQAQSIKISPSQKLSDLIVKRLVSEGIISTNNSDKISVKIAEGSMRQEDWRLLVETQRKVGV